MKKILILLFCVVSVSSCYNTRLYVGSVTKEEPLVEVNKKWNDQFIAGLVTTKNAKLNPTEYVNNAPNYVVKTNQTFLTGLVGTVTFGIYTPTQTKFYIPLKDYKADQNVKTSK